jgi:hypothetical protein
VTRVFESLDDVRAALGEHLGVSDWVVVDQARLDRFSAAVGGGELAAPYLALALSNLFLPEIVEVRGASLGVNYGTGAVRFPAPVAPGTTVRGRAELVAVDDISGGIQTTMAITIETDAGEPVCTVEALSRFLA